MSCAHQENLTAWVDEELPELQRRQLEAHLPTCPECTATAALLRRTVGQLAGLPSSEPSVALRHQLMQRLEALPPTFAQRLKALARPAVWIPAMGLATAATLFWVKGQPTSPALEGPEQLAVAMNIDVLEDLEVLGLEHPDDLELVSQLHDLEATR